jgi:hypothetical protein
MTWKSYAAVSGAGLLATYLVSSPPVVTPERVPPRRAAASGAAEAVDIAEEASRLQVQVPRAAAYDEPSRNPFRFAPRQATRPPAPVEDDERQEPAAPAPESIPQPTPVRVSGIATRVVNGERVREAILVTPAGVVGVREGAAVGTEYRVTRIDDTAVELTHNDGRVERLPLRP